MTLRYKTAILCALLAVTLLSGLPQTPARAITPSDLAPQLEPPQADDGAEPTGVYGTYVTLTDPATGVAVMDTMLPRGWTAQLQTNWGFVSTTNPCLATAFFTSPDGQAQIIVQTAQDYLESPDSLGLMPLYEGVDMQTYITYLGYKNAGQFLDAYFNGVLGTGGVVIQETPVDSSIQSLLQQTAKAYLDNVVSGFQSLAGPYGYSVWAGNYEGTASFRRYRFTAADGNSYVADAQCLCICIEYTTNNGYVTNTDRPWTVPMCTFFIAPDEATLDRYKDDANMILDNIMQNDEFTYMKQAYGRDIRNKIMLQQTNQISAMTEAQAQTYMNDYEPSTSSYTSDDWANDWSDYIYDQQEYTTVDGNTIKASTSYDAVFQNGDEFYFGSVGSAPDGWTQLTPN